MLPHLQHVFFEMLKRGAAAVLGGKKPPRLTGLTPGHSKPLKENLYGKQNKYPLHQVFSLKTVYHK